MPAEIPTKSRTTLPTGTVDNTAAHKTLDRFHPEMPQIPGVTGARPPLPAKSNKANSQRIIQILGAAAVVAVVTIAIAIAIVWWVKNAPRKAVDSTGAEAALSNSALPQLPQLGAIASAQAGSSAVATLEELSKPWSAKKFNFVKPFTSESTKAMVMRLPGGALWAFSLQEPFGQCELEFVKDTNQLAAKYGYHATHPMVVNPCNSTVYDPLKVGQLGANTWARGEVVQGDGLRPPLSIDVVVRGRSIIADRME
jgi:hypothetical protein